MRKTLLIAVMVLSLVLSGAPALGQLPAEIPSPPGQVYVTTLNTRQAIVVDVPAFRRLFSLVMSMRSRPHAFDGGNVRATGMPDVLVLQETRHSNLEILRRLLNQRTKFDYQFVSVEGTFIRFLYNADAVSLLGAPETWVDPCRTGADGQTDQKRYLLARFAEKDTNAPFTVAGVHFKAKWRGTTCREQNIELMHTILATETAPVIIGGDFNRGPTVEQRECDLNEQAAPDPWWTQMTSPDSTGESYVDAVHVFHRARNLRMDDEWTFERSKLSSLCTGRQGFRRTRLDYLFASGAIVAEAHADHPGWAGKVDGTRHPSNHPYSDHRWVRGRFVISGPPRPGAPTARRSAGGGVTLTWSPVDGATGYVVYRGTARGGYRIVNRATGDISSFEEVGRHGVRYRYAVSAVGANGGLGRESRAARVVPDARGPAVRFVSPRAGERDVATYRSIEVHLDEAVDPDSVSGNSIALYRNRRPVRGVVRQTAARVLRFNPSGPLRRGSSYFAVVRGLDDRLGNRGERFGWRFHMKPKPPRRKDDRGPRRP